MKFAAWQARWVALSSEAPRRSDGWVVFAVALLARALVVAWAHDRFPPVEDARFYHTVATRIAAGDGYTWLWPDGVVTYAAHYPIGYPALIAAGYAVFGASPLLAMILNAVLGSCGALAAFQIARSMNSRAVAVLAGLFVALHPALVGYTPALMTEGVTAALLAIGGAIAIRSRSAAAKGWIWTLLLGIELGICTLLRPQSLLLAPLFGAVAARPSTGRAARYFGAAAVTVLAIAFCLPWTVRNCVRMDRCVFVSANAGWNLLIGSAPEGQGGFVPLEQAGVPARCRNEFREAAKDACFARAGRDAIRSQPVRWLALVPRKLAMTFDYGGAPGWYLHAANRESFPERAKLWLGAIETLWQRVLVGLALLALARRMGSKAKLGRALALASSVCLVTPWAWLGYGGLVLSALLLGRRLLDTAPGVVALMAAGVVGATGLTHAVFFGAGRYSLVCFALIAPLSASAWLRRSKQPNPGGVADESRAHLFDSPRQER